jgi:predicted MFS family arabinose efflux permease
MLLVYALTRATTDGWTSTTTIGLLAASAALVIAFIGIELRSPAPLLPLRIFKSRTLSAANVVMLIVGSVTFAEFFLLTLYLQDVLHYSAVQSGVAFAGFAIPVVIASNVAQLVVARFGVRATLTAGLAASAASIAFLTRLPVEGHYFWDLFPAFVLGGAGLGLSFVPVTIASLTGVQRSDAGIASGLVNTSRQMGGAIGLAAVSAIAALSTDHYASAQGIAETSASALDHGFQTALYVLTAMLFVGAFVAGVFLRPQPLAEPHVVPAELDLYEEAA